MSSPSVVIGHRSRYASLRLLALVFIASASFPLNAQDNIVTLDALRLETRIGDLSLSPDGTLAVIQTAVRNFDENEYDETLVLIDLATGEERELTPQRKTVGQASWSPDGRLLAYQAAPAAGEKQQVFVLPMAGGEARQITQADEGVNGYQWAADGRSVFYRSQEPAPEPPEGE